MNTELVFIDDEEDILNLLRLKFRALAKKEGIELRLFSSSAEFEEYIATVETDVMVIVSDINMPNNKVLESLQEQKSKFKFTLTYLCSAYSKEQFKSMIDDFNVMFFFRKPLNINHMRDKLLEDLKERGIQF